MRQKDTQDELALLLCWNIALTCTNPYWYVVVPVGAVLYMVYNSYVWRRRNEKKIL